MLSPQRASCPGQIPWRTRAFYCCLCLPQTISCSDTPHQTPKPAVSRDGKSIPSKCSSFLPLLARGPNPPNQQGTTKKCHKKDLNTGHDGTKQCISPHWEMPSFWENNCLHFPLVADPQFLLQNKQQTTFQLLPTQITKQELAGAGGKETKQVRKGILSMPTSVLEG